MRKHKKIIILASINICCLIVAAYLYTSLWVPNQKMRKIDWWEHASKEEMRRVSHQVLKFPIGNHHDAFMALEKIGNATSVPLLIRALKWQDSPGKDGFLVCTTDHCLSALRSLTGVDKGTSFKAWNEWWENTGKKRPSESFYPRALKESKRIHK